MEVRLIGTEVHVLREILEGVVNNLEKEIGVTEEPKVLGALVEKRDAIKSIMDKFPVEFAFAA